MRGIHPDIPDEWKCTVVGYLIESDNPEDLGEDMLEVALQNGILISAGWSPESDPSGQYVVSVSSGLSHLIPSITADDADAVAAEVVRLADTFRGQPNFSDSDNQFQQTPDRSGVEFVSG